MSLSRFTVIMLVARSLAYNLLFYLMLAAFCLAFVPALLLPRRAVMAGVKAWARTSIWLLRVVAGTRIEVRGRENIPQGPLLVAAKHQSALETFALIPELADPTYILKRELLWLPVFGWFAAKAGMIPVDRGRGAQALKAMGLRARAALDEGRQIIIFPEGTRRAPGAPPAYKFGVAHLYADLGVPCVPVALNTGVFWPRRSLMRHPGTVVIEFLPAIAPGMARADFAATLEATIEAASNRLLTPGEHP